MLVALMLPEAFLFSGRLNISEVTFPIFVHVCFCNMHMYAYAHIQHSLDIKFSQNVIIIFTLIKVKQRYNLGLL